MNLEKYMIPCLFKKLFGMECLGCGFQRSLFLLFQGEFLTAFKMYPAVYTSLLFLVLLLFYFFDKSRNYQKIIWKAAALNVVFMCIGYYFKHFLF
ncbi:hypothetical protein ASE21_09600 [Flavobacterium sp. Root901]|uniref:DUF2752 domain-containing protein n=1 Tax=Flavobacterium sp. Root901 TaxID=1736605 RepID=UPI00070EA231|nr:DUF2752 domain-containing protein [Flavobacterium sp. Root901]KRD09969.1 hypothetical protein ASE21_09600 [Flavobacterium sp. Root901]